MCPSSGDLTDWSVGIYVQEDSEIGLTNQIVTMKTGISWFRTGISGEIWKISAFIKGSKYFAH